MNTWSYPDGLRAPRPRGRHDRDVARLLPARRSPGGPGSALRGD